MAAAWLLGAVLLSTAWVQSAVLSGGFFSDDFLWFYRLANIPWFEFVGMGHGGHLLFTRNLVYWICYQMFGLEPAGYFWLALLTHLLNVALLFALILHLSQRPLCAALAAALWGLAPISQGSLRWVSVYGHVMAATFALLLFTDLIRIARRDRAPTFWQLGRWMLLLLGMATSFGTGLGVAVGFPVIAWVLLPPACGRTRVALLLMAVSALIATLFLIDHDGLPSIGLGDYPIAVTVMLATTLMSYGLASLALGPFFTFSEGHILVGPLHGIEGAQILPAIHGFALALVAGPIWAFARAGPLRRRQIAAFVLLAACASGAIALGRAPIMVLMSLDMTWMATATRYHYLAQLGLAVMLGLAAAEFADTRSLRRLPVWLGPVLFCVGLPLALPSYANSARTLDAVLDGRWMKSTNQILQAVQQIVRATPIGSQVYVPNQHVTFMFLTTHQDFPGWAAVFVMLHPEDTLEGRRVYFVESDAELVQKLRGQSGRIARLLVTPLEADRGTPPRLP